MPPQHILVIGAGGLGSAALPLLAAAAARLTVIDHDKVELSNLSRQLLYNEDDLARPKAEVAAERLRRQFPNLAVRWRAEKFSAENAAAFFSERPDLAMDLCDNETTRLAVSDAAFARDTALVTAGLAGMHGQIAYLRRGESGCYRCAFGAGDKSGEGTASAAFATMTGSMAALVALRALAGNETAGRVVLVDGETLATEELRARADPKCAVCGHTSQKGNRK
ncbi:MAG: ThiF family adenylyltransferase [Alphaproteobacteria bacterium]|nr:ThiF family adenylyltransferase [Alphaproteobacteria bacterium]MDA7989354.1 ThiF family adenylyltransferase [Alphaproteobacteria bacterium]MDA8030748.1 ThiF family adenylyltransferase [Alphaproteobacteria bacterium]